jgi:hypothetical protein
VLVSLLPHSTAAFPGKLTGRLPHLVSFEACSAFTHVSACMLAGSPVVIRYIRGFDGLVASSAAPTATGWNDPSPGGTCTHWKSPPLHGAQFSDTTGSWANGYLISPGMTDLVWAVCYFRQAATNHVIE